MGSPFDRQIYWEIDQNVLPISILLRSSGMSHLVESCRANLGLCCPLKARRINQKSLPNSPVPDTTSIFLAIPVQYLLWSTLADRVAARHNLPYFELGWQLKSGWGNPVLSFFQEGSFFAFLMIFHLFSTDTSSVGALVVLFNWSGCIRQRLSFFSIPKAEKFNRFDSSSIGCLDKGSLRRAHTRA